MAEEEAFSAEVEGTAAHFIRSFESQGSSLESSVQRVRASEGAIHVVISTLSGSRDAEAFYKRNIPVLLSKFDLVENRGYTTHYTKSATTVSELARDTFAPQALAGEQILVIILSGDGGIIDLLNGFSPHARTDGFVPPLVAVLPFGTANALAHSTNIASDGTSGLRALCYGLPKHLPSFRVQFSPEVRLLVDEGKRKEELSASHSPKPVHPTSNGHMGQANQRIPEIFGAVVCSWGFHAAIVGDSDTAEFRKHGINRFKLAAQEALNPPDGTGPHQYAGDVYFRRADAWTKIPRDKHAYILATAVSNLEKTFTISPASKPMDGSLRLVHFGPLSGDDIIKIMMQAYDGGKHIDNETVGYEQIDELWIDFKENAKQGDDGTRWRRVCVDGKIIAVEENGWINLKKNQTSAMQLLVPET